MYTTNINFALLPYYTNQYEVTTAGHNDFVYKCRRLNIIYVNTKIIYQ